MSDDFFDDAVDSVRGRNCAMSARCDARFQCRLERYPKNSVGVQDVWRLQSSHGRFSHLRSLTEGTSETAPSKLFNHLTPPNNLDLDAERCRTAIFVDMRVIQNPLLSLSSRRSSFLGRGELYEPAVIGRMPILSTCERDLARVSMHVLSLPFQPFEKHWT